MFNHLNQVLHQLNTLWALDGVIENSGLDGINITLHIMYELLCLIAESYRPTDLHYLGESIIDMIIIVMRIILMY